jgi:hypothetical protein
MFGAGSRFPYLDLILPIIELFSLVTASPSRALLLPRDFTRNNFGDEFPTYTTSGIKGRSRDLSLLSRWC